MRIVLAMMAAEVVSREVLEGLLCVVELAGARLEVEREVMAPAPMAEVVIEKVPAAEPGPVLVRHGRLGKSAAKKAGKRAAAKVKAAELGSDRQARRPIPPAPKAKSGYKPPADDAAPAFTPPEAGDMGCRAQVWRALKKGPATSKELAETVAPLGAASVSLALSELRLAGVVKSEQDGRDRIHSLVER